MATPSSPRRKRRLLGEAGVAPADCAARVTSRQEEPLRASAWPASPTNSAAQRRRDREERPSGQVKAHGQRGVAAAAHLRLCPCPELRSRGSTFVEKTEEPLGAEGFQVGAPDLDGGERPGLAHSPWGEAGGR